MSTYRERREAKADRLRAWADGRDAKAAALHERNEPYRGDIAFNTQPGHIPERARVITRTERAWEHSEKAAEMRRRADAIDAQADRAIYSDDPDACERLAERIAGLEAERDRWKRYNAAVRRAPWSLEALELLDDAQREELGTLARVARFQLGKNGEAPAYVLSNLGGNIRRLRERLARLERSEK